MVISTATITGSIPLPDTTAPETGAYVEFTLTSYDTELAVVLPKMVRAQIATDGTFSAVLWPNGVGIRSTQYNVTVREPTKRYDLGNISIPSTGAHNLHSLLGVSPSNLLAINVQAAQSAEAAAISKLEAEAAAAAALVSEGAADASATAIIGLAAEAGVSAAEAGVSAAAALVSEGAADASAIAAAASAAAAADLSEVTLAGAETLTNKTLTAPALTDPTLTNPAIDGCIIDEVFTITDAAGFQIDPGNGAIQQITLTASRTPLATNFANGETITLRIADGTAYTITWSTIGVVWAGGTAPTLAATGFTEINLQKAGGVVRGVYVGDFAS